MASRSAGEEISTENALGFLGFPKAATRPRLPVVGSGGQARTISQAARARASSTGQAMNQLGFIEPG
jgi:hypothetical protein